MIISENKVESTLETELYTVGWKDHMFRMHGNNLAKTALIYKPRGWGKRTGANLMSQNEPGPCI
jgi:hypothetical protein